MTILPTETAPLPLLLRLETASGWEGSGTPDALAGWCLAPRRIRRIELILPSGDRRLAVFGFGRYDVGEEHPEYPDAGRSGFLLQLPPGSREQLRELRFVICLHSDVGEPAEVEVRVPHTFGLHSFPLSELDAVPPAGVDNRSPQIEAYLRDRVLRSPSLVLRLDVVNKCNLRCVMCQFSDEKVFRQPMQAMTPDEFEEIFDDMAPLVHRVSLSCAYEPLTSPHFGRILEIIGNKPGARVLEFCTNATLLTSRVRRQLIEAQITHLQVSLDGCRRETVERIRVGARYDKLVGNLLALRDLKRAAGTRLPIVTLNYVMGRSNIHEAPAFVELASRAGASEIDFRHMWPYYFGQDRPTELLVDTPATFNYYRPKILAAAERLGMDIVLPEPFDVDDDWQGEDWDEAVLLADFEAIVPDADEQTPPTPKALPADFDPRRLRERSAPEAETTLCSRPFEEVFLRDGNRVFPCPWHKRELGRLGEGRSLSEIFFGEEFARLRHKMYLGEEDIGCTGCPLKSGRMGETPVKNRVKAPRKPLNDYELQLEDLENERAQMRAHIREIESENAQMNEHNRTIEAESVQMRAHIETVEAENEHMRGHISTVEAELSHMRPHIRSIENENFHVTAHSRTVEAENEHMRGHISAIEAELAQTGPHIQAIEEECERLREHVSNLERVIAKTHAMPIYRTLGRVKSWFVRGSGRSEPPS